MVRERAKTLAPLRLSVGFGGYCFFLKIRCIVSVIHYDELEHCRHSLNNYDVYGLFIADETLEELTYGLTTYDLHRHALMCVSPGQIGGKADIGEEIQTKGWALLFDPVLVNGTDLEKRIQPTVSSHITPMRPCSWMKGSDKLSSRCWTR